MKKYQSMKHKGTRQQDMKHRGALPTLAPVRAMSHPPALHLP